MVINTLIRNVSLVNEGHITICDVLIEGEMIKEIKSFDSQSEKLEQEYFQLKDDLIQLEEKRDIKRRDSCRNGKP